jgi:hypothetical protein
MSFSLRISGALGAVPRTLRVPDPREPEELDRLPDFLWEPEELDRLPDFLWEPEELDRLLDFLRCAIPRHHTAASGAPRHMLAPTVGARGN